MMRLIHRPLKGGTSLLHRIDAGDGNAACELAEELQTDDTTDVPRIDDAISLLLPLVLKGDPACGRALLDVLGQKAALLPVLSRDDGPEAASRLGFSLAWDSWRRKLQNACLLKPGKPFEEPASAQPKPNWPDKITIRVCAPIPLSGDAATDMRLGQLTILHKGIDLLPAPDPATIEAELVASMPGMQPVIERICDEFWLRRRSGNSVFSLRPILLVGPPGIGKTYFAQVLARMMHIPLQSFSAGGSADARTLLGTARGYHSAQPSLPVLAMAQARAANPMLLVDEIDKASDDRRNGSVKDALLAFLEPASLRRYYDEFAQVEIDLSHIVWILTANSTHDLPTTLRSRLMIIELQPPAPEAFDRLLPGVRTQLAHELGAPVEGLPELSAEQLGVLRGSFTRHRSIRLLQMTLRRMLAVNARMIMLH